MRASRQVCGRPQSRVRKRARIQTTGESDAKQVREVREGGQVEEFEVDAETGSGNREAVEERQTQVLTSGASAGNSHIRYPLRTAVQFAGTARTRDLLGG